MQLLLCAAKVARPRAEPRAIATVIFSFCFFVMPVQ
jgi:hypothetical protein